MKRRNDILRKILRRSAFRPQFWGIAMAVTAVMSSCSMITEDLEPCAPEPNTYTTVNFVYDYNMQREDLFNQHVGSVYLYVFDNDGIYRYRREAHRAEMEGDPDFSLTFNDREIVPGNTYQFVAIASANHIGYEASQETPGFTLQTEMIPGVSKIEDYILKLDRDDDGNFDFGVVNYKDAYGNNEQMIDTIWTTKPDEVQIVDIPKFDYKPSLQQQPDNKVDVTVPMMRITNSITVNLKGGLFNENTKEDDYHILIRFPHGNGTIDFTGNTQPAQELIYQTLRKRVRNYDEESSKTDGIPVTRAGGNYGIESVFGVSRLQIHDESSLQIWDSYTNELVAEIPNFSEFLAEYFEHGFDDDQEFLDREYDFEVEVELNDQGIVWVRIWVEILGWTRRIQFIDF